MNIEVVTSFSPEGYQLYGKRFVESFAEHVTPSAILTVYHESQGDSLLLPGVEWRNLDHDRERGAFIAFAQADPERVSDARYPNRQSVRFCHKVFALSDAASRSRADWLVWVDADVEWTAKPDWDKVLPADKSLSFLHRPRYRYTECGFVGYRISDGRVLRMIEAMRRYYTEGEIWRRHPDDRHDGRCFDICRERSQVPPARMFSLCSGTQAGTHVWPHSLLAAFSVHHKGPARKATAYGGVVP